MINFDGSDIMHNKYSYDAVDNILGIANTVNPQELSNNSAKLGGESSHTYQYDALNRLISASGKAKDASYTLDMAYNVMSMPVSKAQSVENSSKAASYTNVYKYEDAEHPTAPSQIGHEHYTYDANGNPVRIENDSTDATRELYWDEDNRLMVLSDNGKTSRYTYNHAGERIVKSHGSMEGVYINGAPQGITFHETDEYTLYPASILSVTKNRFTKHYFIGSKRVASRIGSGSFNNMYGVNGSHVTAGQQDYAERLSQIESQKEDYYKKLGIAPGIPTMKGSYADPENTGIGYNTIIKELGDHSVPAEWAQYVKKNEQEGTAPGTPIAWDEPSDPDEAQPGYGFVADSSSEEEETYFFHSDHLGSTSYITDKDGNITQYDAYLPYGELLVDEHSSSEEMPYKFNGKEFDEETGLYYYGARYMNPVASVWYGVDPLTEKYTNMGGYVYCAANPIKLVDPDGKKLVLAGSYKERMAILKVLQGLTNDNLLMDRKTGVVTIGGKRWSNRDKNYKVGTALVRDVINNKRTTTVKVNYSKRTTTDGENIKNKSNGVGTNAIIDMDLRPKDNCVDAGGGYVKNEETSPEIILGHELIHAYRTMNGKIVDSSKTKPVTVLYRGDTKSNTADEKIEELQTIGIKGYNYFKYTENKLRKEHDATERTAHSTWR